MRHVDSHDQRGGQPQTPENSPHLTMFDRFATAIANRASRAGFFVFCVALVVIWIPSILVLRSVDTWQLVINTATTIITFLLVALLQNTQSRSDAAVQAKLNALSDALSDFMGELSREYPELDHHRRELIDAVGLEEREGSS